ncbi:MAG: ATP-grasp domain-containing protein, partial [Sneathiellales bacterium]|nr:ATP-grasp domain-containing protein [Sneathiellales bacterium]
KLLIANRGEIACRIARTARQQGIQPIAIHSDADATAHHVREIGLSVPLCGTTAAESYLDIKKVIDVALSEGADAVHPGYGFLSENPDFAERAEKAGLIFVGPTPGTLRRFGDKAQAKEAAIAANISVISGGDGAYTDPEKIRSVIETISLPVLLKASAGGGGRGQRLVTSMQNLDEDIEAALREAESAFGTSALLVEKQITGARHIEIQIAGDGAGNVLHFYERDCTLQRRHQKVIEEAPAAGLDRAFLDRIADDAVRLGKELNYRGLGTVEFLVSKDKYYFLEVNPRLQVEHPVTEEVTGIDLVALQLSIANGLGLGLEQEEIRLSGHAIESRLYAEDPDFNFAPSTGKIKNLHFPDFIRLETGVDIGDEITPFYDPMIAKLISYGDTRDQALDVMSAALDQSAIKGLQTNLSFLKSLCDFPEIRSMTFHTRFIDQQLEEIQKSKDVQSEQERLAALAGLIWCRRNAQKPGTWSHLSGWRLSASKTKYVSGPQILVEENGAAMTVTLSEPGFDGRHQVTINDEETFNIRLLDINTQVWRLECNDTKLAIEVEFMDTTVTLKLNGATRIFAISEEADTLSSAELADNEILSPLTGSIIKILVPDGQLARAGETLFLMESMKMEIPIKAAMSGTMTNLSIEEGAMVDRGQVLATIETAPAQEAANV